jgi:hypothetical protein
MLAEQRPVLPDFAARMHRLGLYVHSEKQTECESGKRTVARVSGRPPGGHARTEMNGRHHYDTRTFRPAGHHPNDARRLALESPLGA